MNIRDLRALTTVPPYGVIAIDNFTKKMHVEPLKFKGGPEWREAMDKIIVKIGKPKVIYSDPDSSIMSNDLKGWFRDKGIKNVITKQHANMAERGIIYLKKRMDDKLENDTYSDGGPESYWVKHYQEAVDHYNK